VQWIDPLQQRHTIPHCLCEASLLADGERSWQVEAALPAGGLSCWVDDVELGKLGLLSVFRLQRTDQLRQFAHHDNRGDPSFMVPLIHHNGAEAGGVVHRARVLAEESSVLGVVVPEVHQLWRRRGSPGKGDSSTMATQ